MAEKGKNPAINIWKYLLRNQGTSVGISRATFVVRVGALNSALQ